jgi:D-tagatose-1,6-bisphosphate aldolase subunit GatZ/KbaZ
MDRARYYWGHPGVRRALARLESNLDQRHAPLALLDRFLPAQAAAVRDGAILPRARALVRHRIREVTAVYSRACRPAGAQAR